MEMEKRLEKLASEIALERNKGFIVEWPDKIKREAVFLVSVFGFKKVILRTKLTSPSLCAWRKKFKETDILSSDITKEKIEVTRIVSNQVNSTFNEKTLVASIIKDKLEFNIYCKDMAEKLAERFFI